MSRSDRKPVTFYSAALVRDYTRALRARVDLGVAMAEALRGRVDPGAAALLKLWASAAVEARRELQQLLDVVSAEDELAGRRFRACVYDEVLWLVAGVDLPPLVVERWCPTCGVPWDWCTETFVHRGEWTELPS